MATFDPISVMRTLMPDIEQRVNTGLWRKSEYDNLARKNAQINAETNPALMSDFDRQMQQYHMMPTAQDAENGRLNKEFWSNNAKMQALGSLRSGGIGNYQRGPSFTPAGPGITDAGEVERNTAFVQPGQSYQQAIAALRKAAGIGG
jgi:hypothetical protein